MSVLNSLKISLQLYRNRLRAPKASQLPLLNERQEKWLSALRAEGVVAIPNYLSSETCAQLRQLLDARAAHFMAHHPETPDSKPPKHGWPTEGGYQVWHDRHQSDTRIIKAELLDPAIAQFFNDPEILGVGIHYLNADLKATFTMANKVEFKEANLGSGGGWHRDMTYKRGFKAMVYLTSVDENTGPFQYVPHSASLPYHLFRSNKPEQYQFTHEEVLQFIGGDASRIKTATAAEGTLLLFETNMIHRGKPIMAGKTRYAMTRYHNL